jgi:hypothetical protein
METINVEILKNWVYYGEPVFKVDLRLDKYLKDLYRKEEILVKISDYHLNHSKINKQCIKKLNEFLAEPLNEIYRLFLKDRREFLNVLKIENIN